MKNDEYININRIAEVKGLKSNRSLRIAINKGKYIAREIQVNGGKSYEILYSSLEFDVQQKLELAEIKSTALIPVQNNPRINYVSEKAKLTSLARVDIIAAFNNFRYKYRTKKEAETVFIDLYNSGLYLPKIHKFMGDMSIGTCRLMRVPKQTEREQQMNKPMFISDYEKYEWLMAHGCTNPEDRKWLADYIRSDEYNDLYGGEE